MLDRGKLAVLTMFAVALVAATFAWWWNYSRGQKCLAFYGKDAALLIRTAQQVELLELAAAEVATGESPVETLEIGSNSYQVVKIFDIGEAKGLIHARTSVVDDTSFRWDTPSGDCQPNIRYAVRFSGDTAATLAFDFGCQSVWHVEQGKSATLIPKVAQGWESFLTRQAAEKRNTDDH
jgi:hypothetical protein